MPVVLTKVLDASNRRKNSLPHGSSQQTEPTAQDNIPPIIYRDELSNTGEGVCLM